MACTTKQQQLLRYIAGCGEPPTYAFGRLAVAIARLRQKGWIDRYSNKLTPLGLTVLRSCTPKKLLPTHVVHDEAAASQGDAKP